MALRKLGVSNSRSHGGRTAEVGGILDNKYEDTARHTRGPD